MSELPTTMMRETFKWVVDCAATVLIILLMFCAVAGVVVVLHGLMKGDDGG